MSFLNLVVTFAVIMGIVAFIAGFVNSVILMRRAAKNQESVSSGSQLGAVLLVWAGGALVGVSMVTAAMVKDSEADLQALKGEVDTMQAKVRVYENGITRMEKALESAKSSKATAEKVTSDLRAELNELRQRRASIR